MSSLQSTPASVNYSPCACAYPGILCSPCESAAMRRYDSPPAPIIPGELAAAARELKACRPALASRIDAALELAMHPHTIQPQYCATVNSCRSEPFTGPYPEPWPPRQATTRRLSFYDVYAIQARLRIGTCPECGWEHLLDVKNWSESVECEQCFVGIEFECE